MHSLPAPISSFITEAHKEVPSIVKVHRCQLLQLKSIPSLAPFSWNCQLITDDQDANDVLGDDQPNASLLEEAQGWPCS